MQIRSLHEQTLRVFVLSELRLVYLFQEDSLLVAWTDGREGSRHASVSTNSTGTLSVDLFALLAIVALVSVNPYSYWSVVYEAACFLLLSTLTQGLSESGHFRLNYFGLATHTARASDYS